MSDKGGGLLASALSADLGRELDQYYESKRLRTSNGQGCPSYYGCKRSCEWEMSGGYHREITPPTGAYVGSNYRASRILFVGINSNKDCDFYGCYRWIVEERAKDDSITGAMHRFVRNILHSPDMKPKETLSNLAFTNVVKCSVGDRFGQPTATMAANCTFRERYLAEEVKRLKPRLIVTFGKLPFEGIQSLWMDSIFDIAPCSGEEPLFRDWLFGIRIEGSEVPVLLSYNPPRGYMNIRALNGIIANAKDLPPSWENSWGRFVPGAKSAAEVKARVQQSMCHVRENVDKGNVFYQFILDKLLGWIEDWGRKPTRESKPTSAVLEEHSVPEADKESLKGDLL